MVTTTRGAFTSPDRRYTVGGVSSKQKAWRKRVNLLWRIKGMIIPMDAPMTTEERENLNKAQALINSVVKGFTDSSVALGFNAVHRCHYCGSPAVAIDNRGYHVCEKHKKIYGTEQEIKTISDDIVS